MTRNVVSQILAYNRDRPTEQVVYKYRKLAKSSFSFLRGTCHLFYADLPTDSPLNQAPLAWICGDLHLENFGTHTNQYGTCFDVNDFDEAALAPCSWDLIRLLTSLQVALSLLQISDDAITQLGQYFLHSYTAALATGKTYPITAAQTEGALQQLLKQAEATERGKWLTRYTHLTNGHRHLRLESGQTLRLEAETRDRLLDRLERWAKKQSHPKHYRVIDIAFRLAGTASLGLERYLILVHGKENPHKNRLLDLKQTQPSALAPYLAHPQPVWKSSAQRVIAIQSRLQSAASEPLSRLKFDHKSYRLQEVQPSQQGLAWNALAGRPDQLALVVNSLATATAHLHLRGSGWKGAAPKKALQQFAATSDWQPIAIAYAQQYAAQVKADYQAFWQWWSHTPSLATSPESLPQALPRVDNPPDPPEDSDDSLLSDTTH